MAYNYQNLSLLDARALMLYASQLDLKIANTFGVYSGGDKLLFSREDRADNEYPFISATPTQYITQGQVSQSRYTATDIIGKTLTMTHTNVNLDDFVDFAFSLESYAMKDTVNGVTIEFEKNTNSEFTVASVRNIIANQTAFRLFGKKTDGTVELVNAGYFDRYTTNRQTGDSWYSDRPNNKFSETVSIDTIVGHSSSMIYEGCNPILKTNCRVFKNDEYAQNYLLTGSTEGGLTDEEPEEPEEPTFASGEYFYDVQTSYFNDMGLTDMTSQSVSRIHVTFEDYPTNEYDATTHYEPIVAIVGANNKVSFRIHNGFGQYITDAWYQYGNIKIPIETNVVSTIMGVDGFHYGMGYDTGVDKYIKSHVTTNMVVLGADGSALPTNPTTDDMLPNTNNNDFNIGLSECWVLSKSNMIDLAQVFNTTVDRTATGSGEYVVAEWITGLSAYSSPLDVICDLFALPISIDGFCDTTAGSFSFNN